MPARTDRAGRRRGRAEHAAPVPAARAVVGRRAQPGGHQRRRHPDQRGDPAGAGADRGGRGARPHSSRRSSRAAATTARCGRPSVPVQDQRPEAQAADQRRRARGGHARRDHLAQHADRRLLQRRADQGRRADRGDQPDRAAERPAHASPRRHPAGPVQPASVGVYDVTNQPDNANQANRAVDNNPSTFWRTDNYFQPFPALKPGIGLMASFAEPVRLASMTITSPSAGTKVEIRVASLGGRPAGGDQGHRVRRRSPPGRRRSSWATTSRPSTCWSGSPAVQHRQGATSRRSGKSSTPAPSSEITTDILRRDRRSQLGRRPHRGSCRW